VKINRLNLHLWHLNPTSADFTGSENITRYSYRELVRATSNFDQANKIGEGGYGPVYKVIAEP